MNKILITNRRLTKRMVKRMLQNGEFECLGNIFGFTPVLFPGGTFDWRSAPLKLLNFFQNGDAKSDSRLVSAAKREHWERCNGLCFYCGKATTLEKWSKDHVIPKSRKSERKPGCPLPKTVGCCFNCNHAKGNMTFEEFLRTNFLSNERRAALGFHNPPAIIFRNAKKQHGSRINRG